MTNMCNASVHFLEGLDFLLDSSIVSGVCQLVRSTEQVMPSRSAYLSRLLYPDLSEQQAWKLRFVVGSSVHYGDGILS